VKPQTFILREARDRAFAIRAVTLAKDGAQVRIGRPTRTNDHNRHYHGLLGDIADQLSWPKNTGEIHDLEWWKRRTTLGWLIDKKKQFEVIESLEGAEVGILLPHTSDLDVDDMNELIEWTASFGVFNGVVFKERTPEPPPSEEAR